MRELIIDFTPHQNQATILDDTHRYRIAVCGRRFGKTTIAIMECIKVALSQAYSRVWYVAPTYRQAEMIAWKLLLRTLPNEIIKRQHNQKLEIELWNGSIIELKGTENEDNLRGVGLNYCVLDEYAYMKPHIWGMIIQPMFATTKGRALFIGTPSGKNHFYQMFLEGLKEDAYYKSFQFKSEDSPLVDREFLANERKKLPENIFRQEYEACFEDFTGLVYSEFNSAYHLIEPFNIPHTWKRVHAIDPAISTGTTAVVFSAIDPDGNIVIYDEYYQAELMVSEHAKTIKGMLSEDDHILIDPHSANKTIMREGQFFAPIDEYREAGINPALGETHLDAGINRVREFLKIDDSRIHPFTPRLKGSPRLFVFNTCKNFIHEIERYRWAERPESKLGIMRPVPFKKNDHLMDCMRYICMSRVSPAEIKQELKYGEKSLHAILKYDERIKKKAFA